MAQLFYIGTHGPDDPTKACIPIHLAVNGAIEADIDAAICLVGDAAVLIQDRYIETLTPLGLPPLSALIAKAVERGVPIFISGVSAQVRGVGEADLAGKNASFTSPPEIARHCAEATNVLVF